jgi:hypothetical protein
MYQLLTLSLSLSFSMYVSIYFYHERYTEEENTVTSSLNELFTDKLGNRMFVSVGGRPVVVVNTPSYKRLLNRYLQTT